MSAVDSHQTKIIRANLNHFGGLKKLALLACKAIVYNLHILDVACDKCNMPHVDNLNVLRNSSSHTCTNCGTSFPSLTCGVGNPLLPHLQSYVGDTVGDNFGVLQVFTIDDVIGCTATLGCTLS